MFLVKYKQIDQVSQIVLENCLALYWLLTAQGGVFAVVNHSCYFYVNEKKQIQTDINRIWQASHLFPHVSQDAAIKSGPDFSGSSHGCQTMDDWNYCF